MKSALYSLLFLLLHASSAWAQNHVLNGGFEQYIKCPTWAWSVTGFCSNWYQYTNATPDYYNSCNTTIVGVPDNYIGYQQAADGQAYMGIALYPEWFEYLLGEMKPLRPGRPYKVSMMVSLADGIEFAHGDLGIHFRRGSNYISDPRRLKIKPHVSYSQYGAITDTKNWVQLTDTFIADSAYDHLILGYFTDSVKQVPVIPTIDKGGGGFVYYYIDSVSVIDLGPPDPPPPPPPPPPTASFTNPDADTLHCTGSAFKIPFKVSRRFDSTNQFVIRLQHTDSSVVWLPPYATDTSGLIDWSIPDSLKPGVYTLWLISTSPADTFYYSSKIRIDKYPRLELSVNTPSCNSNIELVATTDKEAIVAWAGPNQFFPSGLRHTIPNASNEHSGTYFATARMGRCTVSDSVVVKLDCANVQQLSFKVYNRWGEIIYQTTDPKSGWDGRYKGALLDTETVAYILQAVRKNGSAVQRSGNITIIR